MKLQIFQRKKSQILFLTIFLIVFLQTSHAFLESIGNSTYDGVTQDRGISYYQVNGTNGIKAELDNRTTGTKMDYFIRLWLRPNVSFTQTSNNNQVFLEITKTFRCYFNYTFSDLYCQYYFNETIKGTAITINMLDAMPGVWLHVAIGGSSSSNISYVRVDYQDQLYKTSTKSYVTVQQVSAPWNAYVGVSQNLTTGFQGDIREFFFIQSYVNSSQVSNIKNQVIYMNLLTIANYRYQQGSLADLFRLNIQSTQVYLNNSMNNTGLPVWKYDYVPNDVCPAFLNYTYLPRVDSMTFATAELDSRFSAQTNFMYSGSFWMKTYPTLKTTTIGQTARDSMWFFQLEDAFALWFYDQTKIRMYFYAQKSYYETQSDSIFFPQGIWANFQFWIDRTNGYDMKVYDIFRRQFSSTTSNTYLYEQYPTGKFTLAKNMKGYIKQIMLYNKKITLPIAASNGHQGTIKDTNLIIYYKFDQAYLNTSTSSNFYPSLGYNQASKYGPNVVVSGTFSYDIVEWDDSVTFSSPSYVGTIDQSFTLYDGLSCSKKLIYYQTQSNDSYINYTMPQVTSNITQATVEFWFKRTSNNSTMNFLFSLYSNDTGNEYFAIYQASDKYLYCSPFNSMNATQNISLNYTNYGFTNVFWQHVTCKFENNQDIGASLFTNDYYNEYYYSYSLREMGFIYIPNGNYTMIIGNRFNSSLSYKSTFFKEVRFWTVSRTLQQIALYRFTQIDPFTETSLYTYFKMAEATVDIYDYVGMSQNRTNITANRYNMLNTEDTSLQSIICPQYSFASWNTSCLRNPYVNHNLLLLSYPYNTTNAYWVITSFYSDMVSPFAQYQQDTFTYNWTSINSTITNSVNLTSYNQTNITLPANFTTNSSAKYYITQKVQNTAKSFFSETNISFSVVNCRMVYDTTTKQPIRRLYLTQYQGQRDITFYYNILDSCTQEAFYTSVSWTVYPSYLGITGYQSYYDSTSKSYALYISLDNQFNFPDNQNVYFIGNVTYTSNSTGAQTYLNIIYQIKFVDKLYPVINVQNTYNSVLLGESLMLYANNSYSTNTTDTNQQKAVLNYEWSCPQQFQTACAPYKNKKFFELSYNSFSWGSGAFDQSYNFSVSIWRSNDTDPLSNTSSSVLVNWVNIARPDFIISFITGTPQPYIAQDNTFQIKFTNYDVTNSQLSISWSISPNISSSSLTYSYYSTILKISSGAFLYSTKYNITVNVTNKLNFIATKSISYTFTTGSGPSGGSVSVSPSSGTALSTNFTFSISNYISSSYPIKYKVTGVSSSNVKIPISNTYYYANQTFTSYLPQLSYVQFEIVDGSNEAIFVTQTVTIAANTALSASTIASSTSLTQNQIYDSLLLASYELQQLSNSTYYTTITTNKQSVLDYLAIQSKMYTSSDNLTTDNIYAVNKSMAILAMATYGSNTDSIMTQAQTVLVQLQYRSEVFTYCMQDSSFAANYGIALSNLISYYQSAISTSSRLLQTSSSSALTNLQTVLKYKQAYADYYCSALGISSYGVQNYIDTDTYQMVIEKIPLTSLVTNRRIYYTGDLEYIQLPYNIITSAEKNNSNMTNNTCIQVTFYKTNPFKGISFYNQSVVSQIVTQFNIVNDNMTRILETNSAKTYSLSSGSQVQSYFRYYYNDTSKNFKNNQTVVEYLRSDYTSTSSLSWKYSSCVNYYQVQQNTTSSDCYLLGPYFYAVITDLNRVFVPDYVEDDEGSLISQILAFDSAVVPVLIFLINIAITYPIVCICLDKKDYAYIKNTRKDNSDEINAYIERIALIKGKPKNIVIYKKILYKQIDNQEVSCGNLFFIYLKNLHPLFSLIKRFDFRLKRLNRYVFFAIQYSLIAYICAACFGKNYRSDDELTMDRTTYDSTDTSNAIIAGIILSILTLPLPYTLLKCIKPNFEPAEYEENEEEEEKEDQSDRKKQNNKTVEDDDDEDEEQREGGDREASMSSDGRQGEGPDSDSREVPASQIRLNPTSQISKNKKKHKANNDDDEVVDHKQIDLQNSIDSLEVPQDNCLCIKILFVIIASLVCIGSLCFVAIVSGKIPKANSKTITISFFTSVLAGCFVTNMIRVGINACFAPKYFNKKDDEKKGGCCETLIVAHDAIKIGREMHLLIEVKDNEGSDRNDISQNQALQNQKEITIDNMHTNAQHQLMGKNEFNKSQVESEEDQHLSHYPIQKPKKPKKTEENNLNQVKSPFGSSPKGKGKKSGDKKGGDNNKLKQIKNAMNDDITEQSFSQHSSQPRNTVSRLQKQQRYADNSQDQNRSSINDDQV